MNIKLHSRVFSQLILNLFCIFLSFLFCFSPFSISAAEPSVPSISEASTVYFAHLESGTVVTSKNTDTPVSAGSTVKVLSGLLFCESLAERQNETVEITSEMVKNIAGHKIGLSVGEHYTVKDLLYAALCGSYNDAFSSLAVVVGGTRAGFFEQMHQRARSLGALSSAFTDESGVDDSSITTGNDMVKIAFAAYQNTLFMSISSTKKYTLESKNSLSVKSFSNRNGLLSSTQYYNDKCLGMSAGSTTKGGNSVITVSEYNNEHYLCIVMGGKEENGRNYGYVVANRLIDWVYTYYSYREVVKAGDVICTLPVSMSAMTQEVEVKAAEALSYYLPANIDPKADIKYSIRLTFTEIKAPFEEMTPVGYVAVIYQNKVLGTIPLVTASGAEETGFLATMTNFKALIGNRAVRAGLLFFAMSIIAWITAEILILRYRRHKWDKYFGKKLELPLYSNQKENTDTKRR